MGHVSLFLLFIFIHANLQRKTGHNYIFSNVYVCVDVCEFVPVCVSSVESVWSTQ